jgi:hypothetical protein
MAWECNNFLAFGSSRFELGYLEVYGGLFVNTNGLKRFIS